MSIKKMMQSIENSKKKDIEDAKNGYPRKGYIPEIEDSKKKDIEDAKNGHPRKGWVDTASITNWGYRKMEENSRPMKNISLVKLFARQFGVCEKCGYKYNLTVHHRNGNKEDDSFGNLGILCSKKYALWGLIKLRGCHTKMHIKMTVAAGENRLVISGTEYNLPLIGRFRLLIENWYRHKYVYKNNNGK